jgi:hypothetical protein
MSTIKNLSPDQTENLRQAVLKRESSGNYKAINQYGYIGGYQFGAPALEDLGYIKPGASKLGNRALDNPANWRNPPGSKEAFLNNTQLQDKAFVQLSNRNINTMERIGVLPPGADPGTTAGYTATAHLLGPGGARDLKNGVVKADANGTKATEYYGLGSKAATGAPGAPPVAAAGGSAAPAAISSSVPGTGSSPGSAVQQSVPLPKADPNTFVPDLGPIENPLGSFASFNCLFTLSAMTKEEINNPDGTYKAGNRIGQVIFSSASREPSNRVPTEAGQFEYYIDNVEIKALMSFNPRTENTNAQMFNFEIVEPYSMGTLLQSLQLAAEEAGHANYSVAPFLLTLEFFGYDDNGFPTSVLNTTRHLPLQFRTIEMEITASGSKYTCTAIPWNEVALSNTTQILKTDISVTGETVQKMLQDGPKSLQAMINKNSKESAEKGEKDKKIVPDQILILFPEFLQSSSFGAGSGSEDQGATTQSTTTASSVETKLGVNKGENQSLVQSSGAVNKIGLSNMGFTMNTGGEQPTPEENKVAAEGGVFKRNQVNIDPKKREFRFDQGSSITNAINQVVLMSDFGRALVDQKQDENDMMDWFKIETQVYDLDRDEQTFKLQGRDPRLIVYSVVPYKVHASKFLPPNIKQQYENLKKQTVKRYQYIYTGRNTEILDFQIRFNNAYFVTTAPDANGAGNQDARRQTQNSAGGDPQTTPLVRKDGEAEASQASSPRRSESEVATPTRGGGATDDHKTRIAKQFQEALYNSPADQLQTTITIMGDPYFIADSGVGNFSNSGTGDRFNITNTGAIDYQNGEVDILVEFRNPVDINFLGILDSSSSSIVTQFSGVFQVTEVRNLFQSNKFTQEINLIRRPNQDDSLNRALQAEQAAETAETTQSAPENTTRYEQSEPPPPEGPLPNE